MSDEMKLLRAFIEASGFDVEEVIDKKYFYDKQEFHSDGQPTLGSGSLKLVTETKEYKITKKAQPIGRAGRYGLHDFIKENKSDLHGGTMMFTVFGVSHIPLNSFADYKELIANTNPVIADSNGEFPEVWIKPPYRVSISNSQGKLMFEDDIK